MVFIEFKYTSTSQTECKPMFKTCVTIANALFSGSFSLCLDRCFGLCGLVWRLLSAEYRKQKRKMRDRETLQRHTIVIICNSISFSICFGNSCAAFEMNVTHRLGRENYMVVILTLFRFLFIVIVAVWRCNVIFYLHKIPLKVIRESTISLSHNAIGECELNGKLVGWWIETPRFFNLFLSLSSLLSRFLCADSFTNAQFWIVVFRPINLKKNYMFMWGSVNESHNFS